jgi:hypothetical protein
MRTGVGMLAASGLLLLAAGTTRSDGPAPAAAGQATKPRGLPALEASYPLPPLPERSARNASYSIDARLDPVKHTIDGRLLLEWRNITDVATDTFPFHLYWNAFRNTLSTSARGEGRRSARPGRGEDEDRGFGWTHVRAVRLEGASQVDLTPTLTYVQPDDGNADDRTVMQVKTPAPVAPGATARFAIEWSARIPCGEVGRSGWVHDYNFIVQWFPKIGVLQKSGWNAHQFHPWSEFFSDYGVYDVRLTLPAGFVVGATGRLLGQTTGADGSETFRFVQEDVHDFAWTASRRFVEKKGRFDDAGYPPVEIRLLVQPEHAHLSDRYIEATKTCLRSYGAWSAPYPYPQVTVVDPAWNSASGGMEYPTLFTGGTTAWAPPELRSPEGVTIHECGHQFWYGLVGNNEFEEAWLDEGFNTYHTEKAAVLALGPNGWGRRYFGVSTPARGSRGGWPVVAPGVLIGRGEETLAGLRRAGKTDVMARRSWEYRTAEAYSLNSYGKPALSLQTLEGLVGDETMTRILRTYARRYRFGHPTSEDFITVVNEVTGRDYRWFFDETWFSSNLLDYAVSVRNERPRTLAGFLDGKGGGPPEPAPKASPSPKDDDSVGSWESEVTVERRGEVRMPIELLVEFSDRRQQRETWDGQDRWKRFRYAGPAKVIRAVVDPQHKLALDVDPSNNGWLDEQGVARRAATKWSARFLFWLQNLLELHAVLG